MRGEVATIRRVLRSDRGQALVLLVMLVFLVTSGAALAVDVGAAYAFKEKCEFVMEAAALAAVSSLPDVPAARAAAAQVAQANGLDPEAIDVQTPHGGDAGAVKVSYRGHQRSYFARIMGIELFPIGAVAAAVGGGPEAFEYALFSGSETTRLDISGVSLNITGQVHANHDLRIRGASVRASGQLRAARNYDAQGSSVHAAGTAQNVPTVPMPQYDVNTLRAMCAVRHTGNQHWSGQTINVTGGVFVDGNLKLSGVSIQGQGLLIVNGNIEFAGTSFRYSTQNDNVCVYSLGNVRVTGTSFVADGIIYAPNGEFESHGSSLTVNGAIVANTIDFSGVSVTIHHNPAAKTVFPGGTPKLTR